MVHQMLEVSVLHHHMNIDVPELTTVVVPIVAVGMNAPYQHLLRNAFKIFQIVTGFIQKILVTSKHFKLEVILMSFYTFRTQASLGIRMLES